MQVYRFHERVAINPPDGPTFYLLPEQATRLGAALMAHSQDCHENKFTQSTLAPVVIETEGS